MFGKESFKLSEKLFHSVQSFIDETYIQEKKLEEYGVPNKRDMREIELQLIREYMSRQNEDPAGTAPLSPSLDELMSEIDEPFPEALIRLIVQKGLSDPEVYKKANIDRKLFSKIKNSKNYKPCKVTCIAFAIALELSLDETRELIGKAGYALTHSSKFDIIIEYFILGKNYDIFEINEVLFAFGQPLIGG